MDTATVVKPGRKPLWKRWSVRIPVAVLLLVVVAYQFLGPSPPPVPRSSGETMQAFRYHEYGDPGVMRLERVDRPLPDEGQVLVRVRAAAANPLDWHELRGTPYVARVFAWGLRRPVDPRVGADFAGEVVAVGPGVTKVRVGDAVYGVGGGAFAEYVRARELRVAAKPANLSFEEAAAVPVAAITALQALRDQGRVRAGQKVLINGASGGVGTFAVQIAKALGAEVTGVCSTRNVELVRSLGADHVIDYTAEDFTQGSRRYDVIVDNVVNRSAAELKRVLAPAGIHVSVGGGGSPEEDGSLGYFLRPVWNDLQVAFSDQQFVGLLAEVRTEDLDFLRGLIESGRVRPVIERTYALAEAPDAIRHVETGRTRGKVVVRVDHPAG